MNRQVNRSSIYRLKATIYHTVKQEVEKFKTVNSCNITRLALVLPVWKVIVQHEETEDTNIIRDTVSHSNSVFSLSTRRRDGLFVIGAQGTSSIVIIIAQNVELATMTYAFNVTSCWDLIIIKWSYMNELTTP